MACHRPFRPRVRGLCHIVVISELDPALQEYGNPHCEAFRLLGYDGCWPKAVRQEALSHRANQFDHAVDPSALVLLHARQWMEKTVDAIGVPQPYESTMFFDGASAPLD